MCEVTKYNFKQKLPEIKSAIDNAKLVAIDLEFSALYPIKNEQPSLFDSSSERYTKLKKNLEKVIPVQLGLTTFSYNADRNFYEGTIYNVYLKPGAFPSMHTSFYFQSECINFLTLYDFNFNKFAYESVPFLNKTTETELRKNLKNSELTEMYSNYKMELEDIFDKFGEEVRIWYEKAPVGDKLSLPKVYEKYRGNLEIMYFIQKSFRARFKNLWTKCDEDFVVFKVSDEDLKALECEDIDEDLVDDLLGFTQVFRHLVKSKKPLIGHNCLLDVMLLINSFECDLPSSFSEFKKLSHSLFPTIYDTKRICFELKNLIPEEKRYHDTSLGDLFEYFKNGTGRHVVLNSPAIDAVSESNLGNFHEAGWDSYCSGYVFIRLAYLNICKKYPASKRFVSSELIGGMVEHRNKINMARGYVNHINLEGQDPPSSRPPWLIIESNRNKTINISQVTSILSSYGCVEIKRLSYKTNGALVAVDNFGNARRIINTFKTNKDFKVRQYNVFKHSPVMRAFVFSGITISGALLLWLTHSVTKRVVGEFF
ncbi:unnamed protein product [Brassicogethes aeneus]|uniref:Uncharacterized protein n=1 Tax=Brassicogethes aeneus TaxID=1431903 RepID=A0A9P0B4T7_BRAAE|nr:unnamed protein product [Brassicogethes aeneus]